MIAGLAADGITVVDDIVYIQRGYENFEDKLRSLGAEIERVSNEKESRIPSQGGMIKIPKNYLTFVRVKYIV